MSMHFALKGLIESLDEAPLKTSGRQQNEFDQTTAKLETRNLNARCYWQDVSNGSRGTAQHFIQPNQYSFEDHDVAKRNKILQSPRLHREASTLSSSFWNMGLKDGINRQAYNMED